MARLWTKEEKQRLISLYPDMSNAALATMLNRTVTSIDNIGPRLNLRKSDAYMAQQLGTRGNIDAIRAFQFKPGNPSPNKGRKQSEFMSPEAYAKFSERHWKKGDPGIRAVPIGTESVWNWAKKARAILYRKIGDNAWRPVHYIRWEERHGPLGAGVRLRCKSVDTLNTDPDNWYMETYQEHIKRVSMQNMPEPLRSSVQALANFKSQLSKIEKKQHEKDN